MTVKQSQFLKTRIHWAKGRFDQDELNALMHVADSRGGTMDHFTIRGLLDALTSLEVDAYRLDALDKEVKKSHVLSILRNAGYQCPECKRIGSFLGSFCISCNQKMNMGYRTHETLEATYNSDI